MEPKNILKRNHPSHFREWDWQTAAQFALDLMSKRNKEKHDFFLSKVKRMLISSTQEYIKSRMEGAVKSS